MNSRARTLLLVFIVLVVVAAAAVITLRAPGRQAQQEAPAIVIKRPELLPSIDRSLGIAGSPTDFGLTSQLVPSESPVALPIYKVSFAPVEANVRSVAAGLGFLGSPGVDTKGLPTIWAWSEDNKTLTARLDTPLAVSFGRPPQSLSASATGGEAAKNTALDFLQKTYELPSPLGIMVASSTTVAVNNAGVPHPDGSIYQATLVSFYYSIAGRRVFFELRNKPSVTAFVDGSPGVYRTTFVFPPTTVVATEEQAIATQESAVSSIKTKGVLVGVEKSNDSEESGAPDFDTVAIVKSELVYFYEKIDQELVPAYLFTGRATKSGVGPITAQFLVRATD